ncbi:MAG: competence/damage-inducible protein A [Candidatus Onthomonas sp.]|nr:competence/damage-inducible protein A [Candidatus Onthomonas sp.]
MTAEILCVGTELLLGDIVNTNAAYIARELARIGIDLYHQTVVGDNPERLKRALNDAFERADLVVTTGGLGPTFDDVTKETVAAYFGKKMVRNQEAMDRIASYYEKRGIELTDNTKKQADLPEGCIVFQNNHGTAPGLAMEGKGKVVIMLPGPPSEMIPMFDNSAVPYLMQYSGKTIVSSTIHFFGIGESLLESRMHEYMLAHSNPSVAPYAKDGEVQVRVTASAHTKEEAEAMIQPVVEEICRDYGKYLYGVDIGTMQNALVQELRKKGLTIAVAEGCSGGNVVKRITEVPGSDQVFEMGVVTNTVRAREKLAGVKAETMAQYGVYSEETAREMAEGIRNRSGADIGIAITGRTGLESDTVGEDLGLVYVAVDSEAYRHVTKVDLAGNRKAQSEFVRYVGSSSALWNGLKAAWKS